MSGLPHDPTGRLGDWANGRAPFHVASGRRVALVMVVGTSLAGAPVLAQRTDDTAATRQALEWRMPKPKISMPMLAGVATYQPPITPFLPGLDRDPATLPFVRPREVVELADGDTLDLTAMMVRRVINGRTFIMYGFNGQQPGPLITVRQRATIVVNFSNAIDLPTTVHWHGLRLDNRFDGVPGVTQEPVRPGERFVYHVYFPDAGIYWYHPHVREDIQQELGLYGNMLVRPIDPEYYNPVNREEVVVLDDLLLDRGEIVPFGEEASNFTLMGRRLVTMPSLKPRSRSVSSISAVPSNNSRPKNEPGRFQVFQSSAAWFSVISSPFVATISRTTVG